MAFPGVADHLSLLVQNGQTYQYIWLGCLKLNCSQDICCHLHRVTVKTFQMIWGTVSLPEYPVVLCWKSTLYLRVAWEYIITIYIHLLHRLRWGKYGLFGNCHMLFPLINHLTVIYCRFNLYETVPTATTTFQLISINPTTMAIQMTS